MKLGTSLIALSVVLGGATIGSAQVISNVCWTVNGFPVRTSLTGAGSAAGVVILDVDGYGTSTNAPIKGTLTVPATGNLNFSFLIQAAGGQNAVVHQLSLNRVTLGGSGNFRWFDGSNTGATTAVFVACPALAAISETEDLISQGLN